MAGFLLILVLTLIFANILSKSLSTNTRTCDQFKEPHKWIVKGKDPYTYLICEKCKMLPNGDFEEGPK